MSESATPDDDFDYLADAPPATDWPDDDEMSDEEDFVVEQPVPITRSRPIVEMPVSPELTRLRRPNPGPVQTAPAVMRQADTSKADIRLGLWGAPRSGKTTYLNALRVAAQKPAMGYRWTISGCDAASTDFLNGSVKRFVRDKDFPMPTIGYGTLSWRFEASRHRSESSRFAKLLKRLSMSSPQEVDIEFVVELQDAAGEYFGEGYEVDHSAGVHNHLMNTNGIVYMFDPIGNREEETKSFDFYFDTLERLKSGMRQKGLLAGSKLPHFLSVCVTKFDHPEIFNAAMREGIIYQANESSMPVVPPSIAPEFLRSLCQDEGARWVCDSLESEFLPERIRYFATSAVGFHLSNGRFNLRNFSNMAPDGRHFLSAAEPINVLEPIISLERRVREQVGMA